MTESLDDYRRHSLPLNNGWYNEAIDLGKKVLQCERPVCGIEMAEISN